MLQSPAVLDLAGKCALIVGARRVGALVAERLAAEGVHLAIAWRRSRAEAERLAAAVSARVRATLVQGDAAVEEDARRMVERAAADLGGLHFLVNLASDFPRAPLEALDGHAWDVAMAQARASYLLTLHAARRMAQNAGPTRGQVVLFTDWAAGETPYRHYLPYLTAKAAVDYMTRAWALELAPQGILVNAIAPGPTLRPPEMSEEAWQKHVAARTPLGRESSAQEIAEMVATLLRSETVTGETIRIDSGRHLAGAGTADKEG